MSPPLPFSSPSKEGEENQSGHTLTRRFARCSHLNYPRPLAGESKGEGSTLRRNLDPRKEVLHHEADGVSERRRAHGNDEKLRAGAKLRLRRKFSFDGAHTEEREGGKRDGEV